jgi:hypothetical protein
MSDPLYVQTRPIPAPQPFCSVVIADRLSIWALACYLLDFFRRYPLASALRILAARAALITSTFLFNVYISQGHEVYLG